jgi:dihydrofolate reductase
MRYWEDAHTLPDEPDVGLEYAGIWQAAEKIVFSCTLTAAATARTRIEPAFDPGLVRQLKSSAERDITVGGANLAGQAMRAGLVDELHLFLVPAIVGGGKRALPDDLRADLELCDTRRFASGVVYLRYVVRPAG